MISRSQFPGRNHPPKDPARSCSRIMHLEAKSVRSSLSAGRAWSAPSREAAGGWMTLWPRSAAHHQRADGGRLQSSILLGLKPGGHGLTVVGDDAQSIYSFRAATVRNILDFPDQFSPPASIITMTRNYRSTQTILPSANGVIDLAKERFTKNLWT